MRVRVAVALGALLSLGILLAVGLKERPSLAATNTRVLGSRFEVEVVPGQRRCQVGEFVPRDAATLRMFVRTVPVGSGTPLDVTLLDGHRVASTRHVRGYPDGPLPVALAPRAATIDLATLCLRNRGATPIFFAGNRTPASPDATAGPNLPGQRPGEEVRGDLLRAQPQSWFAQSGSIARRFWLFKPGFVGAWTMWACLAVTLLVAVLVVRLVLRTLPRP